MLFWIYFIFFPFPTFFPGLDMMVRSWFLGQRGDSSGRLSGGQIGRDTAGLLRKTGTEGKQRRKKKKREEKGGDLQKGGG